MGFNSAFKGLNIILCIMLQLTLKLFCQYDSSNLGACQFANQDIACHFAFFHSGSSTLEFFRYG
jgi:hypothetical protein